MKLPFESPFRLLRHDTTTDTGTDEAGHRSPRLPSGATVMAALDDALRHRRRKPVALLIFDFLDNEAGARPLRGAAQDLARRLRAWVPPQHLVGHLGENLFAVVINDGTAIGHAEHLADEVIQRLRTANLSEGRQKTVTAIVGMAYSSGRHLRAADLLRNADVALARARAMGRSRYAIVDHIPAENNAAA